MTQQFAATVELIRGSLAILQLLADSPAALFAAVLLSETL